MGDSKQQEEESVPTPTVEESEHDKAIQEIFGENPLPQVNSLPAQRLLRYMRYIHKGGLVLLYSFYFTIGSFIICIPLGWTVQNELLRWYYLICLVVCPLGLLFCYVVRRELLRSLVSLNDVYAIPALIDYIQKSDALWEKESVVPFVHLTRLLTVMKPEDSSLITPRHIKYFHEVLKREFSPMSRLEQITNPHRGQEQLDYEEYWHPNLCIAILNLLRYVGNAESLLLLERCENSTPKYPNQSYVIDALQQTIPCIRERIVQMTDRGTLLRPVDNMVTSELLRPLGKSLEEESELLLRGIYHVEKNEK